jgi:hypothetical protein
MLIQLQVGETHPNMAWKQAEERVKQLGDLLTQPTPNHTHRVSKHEHSKAAAQLQLLHEFWDSIEDSLLNVWIGGSLNDKQDALDCMIMEFKLVLCELDLWKKGKETF